MHYLDLLLNNYGISIRKAEADFINIHMKSDVKYFVDPFIIARNSDAFSKRIQVKIVKFYESFLNDIVNGKGRLYLDAFHEVKPIRLGYSKDSWGGKGIGHELVLDIVRAVKRSKAFKTKQVRDLENFTIFIENVSSDRVSDLISNIILKDLILYTQEFCLKNKIPMLNSRTLGGDDLNFYDVETNTVKRINEKLPFDNRNLPIILVPKSICRYSDVSLKSSQDYYWMGIIPHVKSDSSLFKLLTNVEIKEYQSKKSTDVLIRKVHTSPVPGTPEFAEEYIDKYDKSFESIRIYKEARY